MLERFASAFTVTGGTLGPTKNAGSGLDRLFARFGGCTFDHGLYRVHDARSSAAASAWVAAAYPEVNFPIVPFGFDWDGNQFVLDPRKNPEPQVLCSKSVMVTF